jgi:intracellular sulfur oxidation DsrE/DsrF family protein
MKKIVFAVIALFISIGSYISLSLAAEPMKVVYHVSEAEKVPFVLRNIKNHIKGVGGAENVEIILVAHGPGLKPFHNSDKMNVSSLVGELQLEGVEFDACGNTMNALDFQVADLLPDFVRREEGGVVRIAQLQSEGYMYLRP